MTLAQIKSPFPTITDAVGAAITGGRVYIGVSGLDPETNPQAVFWDEAGITPASQPLIMKGGYIVNGSTPAQPFTAPTFSIRAYDALGNVIWYAASAFAQITADVLAAPTGASLIGTSTGGVTVQDRLDGLSAPTGAGQVGYSQTASYPAGTVGASLQAAQIYNMDAYGADPTGVTASDAALTLVQAAIGTGEGCIQFGAGTYRFTSQKTVTLDAATRNSFCMRGMGPNVTKLLWSSATGGLVINTQGQNNSVQISGLSFLTTQAGGGTALTLFNQGSFGGGDGNLSNIDNVYFAGDDKTTLHDSNLHYWNDACIVTSVSNINFDKISVAGAGLTGLGNGITLQGQATGSNFCVAVNITDSAFYACNRGVIYGTYVQGVTTSQTLFVNGNRGIYQSPGTLFTDQITVTACEFNTVSDQILLDGVEHGLITGNLFFILSANSSAIHIQSGGQFAITGNVINGPATVQALTNGVYVFSSYSGQANTIVGNTFYHMETGVSLEAGSNSWTVLGNGYAGNTTNVTNAGTGNSIGVAVP